MALPNIATFEDVNVAIWGLIYKDGSYHKVEPVWWLGTKIQYSGFLLFQNFAF